MLRAEVFHLLAKDINEPFLKVQKFNTDYFSGVLIKANKNFVICFFGKSFLCLFGE